ncbi:MAG: phosphate ABC transporter substrate-binding protein PstS [Vulcanimicrobiaceae bacterium]
MALVLLSVAICVSLGRVAHAATDLSESGSTLLYPLMDLWSAAYTAAHPDVRLETLASGSGAGIASAIAGKIQIGASDAPLRDDQMTQPRMLDVPLAISAQQIDYNLPEVSGAPLRLSGPLLAAIYSGAVAMWDDRRVAALNPDRKLPHHPIVLIRRAEASGDTYLFTEYLSRTTPEWDGSVHYATRVKWPLVPSAIEDLGNMGVMQLCRRVPYSIAYVGISLLDSAQAAGLGVASLQNRDGQFVPPTRQTIEAAVRGSAGTIPADGRLSLVFAPGPDSYPIVNIEYAIVRRQQTSSDLAATLRAFLNWATDPTGGNAPTYLERVHFVALPANVLDVSRSLVATIAGP